MKTQMFNSKLIYNYMSENEIGKTAFCRQCKISVSTLNKLLNNDFNVRTVALFRLSRVLKSRINDLFSE